MSDECRHGYPIDGDGSPGDRCHQCIYDEGVAAERAAAVAYLQREISAQRPLTPSTSAYVHALVDARTCIERGDHTPKDGK